MIEISSPFRSCLLSPRTANYVAALTREGDNFDYYKWLEKVREEEAEAKQVPLAFTSSALVAAEIGNAVSKSDRRGAWENSGPALMTRAAPLPKAIYRLHHEVEAKLPKLDSGGG
jgi:hypothetical protein